MEEFSPYFTLFGLAFDIPTMIMTVVTSLIVFLIVWLASRNMTAGVPKGIQNFFEWIIEFIMGIAGQFMERKVATKFVALGLTLFLYIIMANWMGMPFFIRTVHEEPIPAIGITEELIEEFHHEGEEGVHVTWWKSPTATPSVTFALALLVLIYAHYLGIKKSPREYFKHYLQPNPWLGIPLHLMEEFIIKPLTLPLRLFGNIFAGEILILVLLGITFLGAAIPLAIWLGYSVFIGAIQAYIFTTLSMVYISQKLSDEH